nr:MAG TPA: hypothetical protein [Caudoviricetes sp.]
MAQRPFKWGLIVPFYCSMTRLRSYGSKKQTAQAIQR